MFQSCFCVNNKMSADPMNLLGIGLTLSYSF